MNILFYDFHKYSFRTSIFSSYIFIYLNDAMSWGNQVLCVKEKNHAQFSFGLDFEDRYPCSLVESYFVHNKRVFN